MEILVKGGSGCIGGHLPERSLSEGHDVVPLNQMHPYSNLGIKQHTIDRCERFATESERSYEFIQGDVRDAALVDRLVEPADYVYHQAGQAGVRDLVAEPRVYDEATVSP